MVHAERIPGMSCCTAAGPTSTDMGVVTCGECLWHLACEALERRGQELTALEAVRRIAELTHPELRIAVITAPVLGANLPAPAPIQPDPEQARGWLATGEDWRL